MSRNQCRSILGAIGAAFCLLTAGLGCSDLPGASNIDGPDAAGGSGGSGNGGGKAGGRGGATGGATGGSTGSGGASADAAADIGASGDAGSSTGGSGGTVASHLPSGPSDGCHATPAAGDMPGKWVLHKIDVTGVAAEFMSGGKEYGTQGGYDFNHRNYFLKLPRNYDNTRAYPLVMSGGGCGATNGVSGNGGGANALPDDQDFAVQVGLSYVYPQNAGACFADGFADTPDLPYFDAVLAEVQKSSCVDKSKVFMSGFSSGAWETYMLSCARAGVIRGVGTQAGGLRSVRPPCTGIPVAAFLTAGTNDANPIHNVDSKTGFDSGSAPARDVILKTNGCATAETAPYTSDKAPATWNCKQYTSCPKAYPVIWCEIPGGHGAGSPSAFWPFWNGLPAP
jgi:polyhydroxybutyrate depolymerase